MPHGWIGGGGDWKGVEKQRSVYVRIWKGAHGLCLEGPGYPGSGNRRTRGVEGGREADGVYCLGLGMVKNDLDCNNIPRSDSLSITCNTGQLMQVVYKTLSGWRQFL
jgi:hypothetical protein